MKHVNIPVFIPHLGCPHDCVFCNQRVISGKQTFDASSVDKEISTALSTIRGEAEIEIAFFGGSFTAIDRSLMLDLLGRADAYVRTGAVKSIRISTRPDYIDDEILDVLAAHHVTDIELGIQSMDDAVLTRSGRGHTAAQSQTACKRIVARGFRLVGQMMIGLPGASRRTEQETACKIAALGAQGARIYPLVVFRDTPLADRVKTGTYTPPGEQEMIARSTDALEIFAEKGVRVLRIGLCAEEGLQDGQALAIGTFHPAIGERVQSELYYRRILQAIGKAPQDELTIFCPVGATSRIVGHKRCNSERLRANYGIKNLKIVEKNSLVGYNILIK